MWGLPGYTFKGIYKELQRHFGSSVQNYIVAARTAQGYEDWHNSTQQERLDVVSRWQAIQVEIEKEKYHARKGTYDTSSHCYLKATLEARKRQQAEKKKNKKEKEKEKGAKSRQSIQSIPEVPMSHPFVRKESQVSLPASLPASLPEKDEFEKAIHGAVAATSRGNAEEDALIEKAIRASVQELHNASKEGDDKAAVHRAIQASVAEAARHRGQSSKDAEAENGSEDAVHHDKDLEAALHQSMQEHRTSISRTTTLDFDDSGIDTDDDENIKLAIEKSKSAENVPVDDEEDVKLAIEQSKSIHAPEPADNEEEIKLAIERSKTAADMHPDDEENIKLAIERSKTMHETDGAADGKISDEELQKAIELSKQEHEEREQGIARSKTEEEIVLEYIKKQSLAEEEHRKSMADGVRDV